MVWAAETARMSKPFAVGGRAPVEFVAVPGGDAHLVIVEAARRARTRRPPAW